MIIDEHENLHNANEKDIHTSFKNHEESGHGLTWSC